MIQSIFYKEWLKTKWFIIVGVLMVILFLFIWFQILNAKFSGQQFIKNIYLIAINNKMYQNPLHFMPAIFALILALFQFVPEINNHKYRLTLLLPANEIKLFALMTGYGYLIYTGFTILLISAFFIISNHFLPILLVQASLANIITWILSGYLTYTWITTVLFEPGWIYRIFLSSLGFTAISVSLWQTENFTTHQLNFVILAYVLLSYTIPYFTLNRLRKGKQ
ncbi:hypothetical protein ACE01N_08280 [Saccharicrinis sp. FJH2]|uniref:hypothetical protein n=1 Tax=Saccharicrinis sp. FJH65 TaxID=3344659 RepID=UPI0035F4D85B